jgi:hypothetical protein
VESFINSLRQAGHHEELSEWKNTIWRKVAKDFIVSLLRNFDVHPMNISFQARDLAAFISRTQEEKLQEWDVVVPHGGEPEIPLAGITVRPAKRAVSVDDGTILVSGRNAKVGSRGVEREGMPKALVEEIQKNYRAENPGKNVPDLEFRKWRQRPLLLIYTISPEYKEHDKAGPAELLALGLSFPAFDDSDVAKQVTYKVNLVEWRSILEGEIDDDIEAEADAIID